MQQGGEFGRYYEDGRTSRTRRPATASSRRAAGDARSPARADVTPGAGRSRLGREILQALSSRTALRRAVLLREILGPPKSLQTVDDAPTRPPVNQQQGSSLTVQNGQHHIGSHQNGVSTVPHRNGHRQLSPGAAGKHPPAAALLAASPVPPSPGPAGHEPPAAAPSAEVRPPSPAGLAASYVEASASAIRRLMRRAGIWR